MDRKTLEYMEERAKKAREIVSRIDDLKKHVSKLNKAQYVIFDGSSTGSYVHEKDYSILNKTIIAFEKAVVEEIERLEQELAEL